MANAEASGRIPNEQTRLNKSRTPLAHLLLDDVRSLLAPPAAPPCHFLYLVARFIMQGRIRKENLTLRQILRESQHSHARTMVALVTGADSQNMASKATDARDSAKVSAKFESVCHSPATSRNDSVRQDGGDDDLVAVVEVPPPPSPTPPGGAEAALARVWSTNFITPWGNCDPDNDDDDDSISCARNC